MMMIIYNPFYRSEFDDSMEKMKASRPLAYKCKKSMVFLVKVLPHAIGAARSLSGNISQK